MKKIIVLSSLLLGVVFLAGCTQQKTTKTQPTIPAPTAAPVVEQPAISQPITTQPTQQDVVYKNDKYGFELTLPKGWEKYTVAIENQTIDCRDCVNIIFLLPSNGVPKIERVLTVKIKDLASATKPANQEKVGCVKQPDPECIPADTLLGKSSQYEFTYSYTPVENLPKDLSSISTNFVKANFKIIGK
jgi:hypothetical protein